MTHPNPSDSRQERIAELEQELAEPDYSPGAHYRKEQYRSELSRLRNESGGGEDGLSEAQWLKNIEAQRPAMEVAEVEFFDELKRRKPFEDALCNAGYGRERAQAAVSVLANANLLPTAAPQPDALRKAEDRYLEGYAEGQRDCELTARHERSREWMNALLMLVFYNDQPAHLRPADYEQRLERAWEAARRLCSSRQGDDLAALSTPAPAQSDERAGLERAAKWHDQRRRDTPDVFEGEFHEVCAEHLRSLAQGDRSYG